MRCSLLLAVAGLAGCAATADPGAAPADTDDPGTGPGPAAIDARPRPGPTVTDGAADVPAGPDAAAVEAAEGRADTAVVGDSARSVDGGSLPDAGRNDEAPPPGYKPSMVAVGWGGLRVLSRDLGQTWGSRAALAAGNNEGTLLRTVIYGGGLYVAVGNAGIMTSPDGASWTRHTIPPSGGWLGGIAHGNGLFVGGGVCGITVVSKDGKTWTAGPTLTRQTANGNCVHIRSVAFGNGTFLASDDARTVHVTKDGLAWSKDSTRAFYMVAFCGGAFKERDGCRPQSGHGVFVRPEGPRISRSLDGKTWQTVYSNTNDFYWVGNPIAFGYSPP